MGNAASLESGTSSDNRLCWIELFEAENVPSPRNSQGWCSHQGRLYVYGGRSPEGRLNDLWELDCETCAWTCLKPSDAPGNPTIRSGSVLVHDGDHTLYVGFGYGVLPVAHNLMYRFDLYSREWSGPLTAATGGGIMPAPRINFRGWYYGDCVWIFGGSPDSALCLGDLWKFDTRTFVWKQVVGKGDAPPPCQWCVCEVWKGPLVVFFGGHDSSNTPCNVFHLFNCETLEWTNMMAESPEPIFNKVLYSEEQLSLHPEYEQNQPPTWKSLLCSSPGSVMFQDSLILWGGWDGKEHRSTMWSVNLKTREWTRVQPKTTVSLSVPSAKCSLSVVMSQDSVLYLFGGWNGWQQMNDLHAVSFSFPSLQRLCAEFISKHLPESMPVVERLYEMK